MADRIPLKSQQNEIFQMIQNKGFDPSKFELNEEKSQQSVDKGGLPDTISKINYSGTNFYFIFDFLREIHYSEFSPGKETLVEEQYPGSWKQQIGYVESWLTNLKKEIAEPDLWEQLSEYQIAQEDQLSPETENDPFSPDQVEQIISGINRIKAHLTNELQLDTEQENEANEKLDYLIDAAKRQGRKDWFHTAIGVIVTISVSLALSPEQANTIWGFLREAVTGIIKFLT